MQAHTAYAAQAATAVLAPRPADNTAMPALYRAALGSQHTERYLAFFQRQDDTGRTLPSWNAAAAFFTLGWMVFRQLWGPALVYLAAVEGGALLLFALGYQWLGMPQPVLAGVALAFWCAACVVPGLYGDAAMHAEVRKKIHKALSASANLPQAVGWLARQAPTRKRLAWVVAAHAALAALALLLWIAFPNSFRPADGPGPATGPVASQNAPMAAGALATGTAAPAAASGTGPAAPAAADQAAGPAPVPAASTTVSASKAAAGSESSAPVAVSSSAQTSPPMPAAVPSAAPESRAPASAADAARPPAPSDRPAARTARPASSAGGAAASTRASTPRPRASAPTAPAEPAPRRQLYINAGLFGDPDNARRAHARLREAGLPASTAQVRSSSGRLLTRVRAGPFTSAAAANAAMAQVQLLGLDAAPAQR